MNAEIQTRRPTRLEALKRALDQGTMRQVHRLVNSMHPAEVASLLESLPPTQREVVWELVDPELEGDVLVELNDEVRAGLIRDMDTEELVAAAEGLEVDDLADLLRELPETVNQQVLRSMDSQDRERLHAVLGFDEDTAGGLMNTDTVSVRPDVTLETVLRYLRMRGEIPEKTDALFVVNRHDRYLGVLPLTTLLTEDPARTVGEVMDTTVEGIPPSMPATQVAALFQDRDLVSAAVVSPADHRLLGRITIDDVVDVIRDEAEHSVMSMAGLDEDADMFAGVVPSARRRGVWLGVNLATAFLAAWVVGLFESTIQQIVALAVLMPIVASMGGVAATQTLTLIVRGLALGQVERANARWLLGKGGRGRRAERRRVGHGGRAGGLPLVQAMAHRCRDLRGDGRQPDRRGLRRRRGAAGAEALRRRSGGRGWCHRDHGDGRDRLRVVARARHAGPALTAPRLTSSASACAAAQASLREPGRQVGFDFLALHLRIRIPQFHQLAGVHRLEQEVAHEQSAAGFERADRAQQRPQAAWQRVLVAPRDRRSDPRSAGSPWRESDDWSSSTPAKSAAS